MRTQPQLAEHERVRLLGVARRVAERALTPGSGSGRHEARVVVPGRFGGAFVTFYHGSGLRGCMGTFAPTEDIVSTIVQVTLSSLRDPRFETEPIESHELPRLDIEISVLSDLTLTTDMSSLIIGVHGIRVVSGARAGCFLPKVASERNWSVDEFLSTCCSMKAGLAADAWRSPACQIYRFTADVFRESDFREGNATLRPEGAT